MRPTRFALALLIVALASLTLINGVPAAVLTQGDPTHIQQTSAAAVQALFDQTATAAPTRTAEVLLQQTANAQAASTAAALIAPTQTIQALFETALTATAFSISPDYARFQVIDVQEFDLRAAPGNTAAYLSPDGSAFAHIEGDTMCMYRLRESGYAQDNCFDLPRDALSGVGREAYWSPDNRHLLLGTYNEALQYLRDTDIRVIDTDTGQLIVLTDDGFEGGLVSDFTGMLDITPRWLDADTLIFLRYAPDLSDDVFALRPPDVMTIDLPSEGALDQPQALFSIPMTMPIGAYALAVDGERDHLAFNYDMRDDNFMQGVWQGRVNGERLVVLQRVQDLYDLPIMMDYSPDGRYLMTMAVGSPDGGTAPRIVSTETGEVLDIDAGFPIRDPDGNPFRNPSPIVSHAAWSPRGSALAYIVRDRLNPGVAGLYLTDAAGISGRQILQGDFYGTDCCGHIPLRWASNDTILIGRGIEPGVLLVRIGR